ncbi:PepSY domain-containing protein [soil metagenome]
MKLAIAIMAVAATITGPVLAQTSPPTDGRPPANQPPADPLQVTPVPPEVQSEGSETIRSKIEQAGYSEIADLARDSTGVWRARAKKGNDAVDIIVDKGGRIKPAPR